MFFWYYASAYIKFRSEKNKLLLNGPYYSMAIEKETTLNTTLISIHRIIFQEMQILFNPILSQ